jgi:hypothetical protein
MKERLGDGIERSGKDGNHAKPNGLVENMSNHGRNAACNTPATNIL